MGTSLDWDAETGMQFLGTFGRFDEVAVGGNWLNQSAVAGILRKERAEASVPQLVVSTRSVTVDAAGIVIQGHEEILRINGASAITKWVDAGNIVNFGRPAVRCRPQNRSQAITAPRGGLCRAAFGAAGPSGLHDLWKESRKRRINSACRSTRQVPNQKPSTGSGQRHSTDCYRRWCSRLDRVLRQEHKAGDKVFVDFRRADSADHRSHDG